MCAPVSAFAGLEHMKDPASYQDAVQQKQKIRFYFSLVLYKYIGRSIINYLIMGFKKTKTHQRNIEEDEHT